MTARAPRPHRRSTAAIARASAVAAIVLLAAACSGGGDDTEAGDPVPTLLTAPVQSVSSSTTSTSPSSSAVGDTSTSSAVSDPSSTSGSSTSPPSGGGDGEPSGPGSIGPTSSTVSSSSTGASGSSSTSTTGATTTTADIEPPPSTPPPTPPVPTAAQPPDTLGGQDADYVLAPKSIVGLQFGASRTTVLNRLTALLGNPTNVTDLPRCPGGPATGYQWFNLGVVVTDRGLTYYNVGMDSDSYGELPIPGWHTAVDLRVGATQADLDAKYPAQVTYGTPNGLSLTFTVSGGADTGISGVLYNGALQSLSAGSTTC